MNITRGELVERYAATFGIDVDEVLAWISSYVNHPEEFPVLGEAGLIEATEKDRAVSIKAYIQRECDGSTAGRIKARLDLEREGL